MTKRGPRAPSQRQLRVGETLRRVLSRIIERGILHDPDLPEIVLTVTEVRMSPDLRNATVFIIPLGGGNAAPYLAALERARSFLRGEVTRQVRLKYAPTLSFKADESFDVADHIKEILHSPKVMCDVVNHKKS